MDVLLWAYMDVFRTSIRRGRRICVNRRRVSVGRKNYVPRTRKLTPGKLLYGPKVGCPINVTSEGDVR